MTKPTVIAIAAFAAASTLLAQDAAKFNGTWKGSDFGQVRKLTWKDGVIHMEEKQANGNVILRDYPTEGQEITMNLEGFWNGAKATGKMEGNKLVVDTTQANGTTWHDEWTMADDGKSYSALRVRTGGPAFGGGGGARGGNAGAPPPAAGREGRGPGGAGAGRGRAGGGGPETFTKIE